MSNDSVTLPIFCFILIYRMPSPDSLIMRITYSVSIRQNKESLVDKPNNEVYKEPEGDKK